MYNIRVSSPESPSHYLDILFYLFSCDSGLFLLINCHSYSEVFNYLGALDSPDLSEVFIREDFRLLFIKSQVPVIAEFC